jgi:glycosyltransferase involved in cell wall biosynthesis
MSLDPPECLDILHVTQPTVGGVARSVSDLLADQVGRGWRVGVACPAVGDIAGAAREAAAEHVRWNVRREPGPSVPAETLRLAAIVRSWKPDVVHLHSSKAGLAGRLALRGRLPTVFQPHGWSFDAAEGSIGRGAAAWERFATRWSDVLVCVSDGERSRGKERGLHADWRVVPNGVDIELLREASVEDRAAARERLGLSGSPLVVCVGRLSEAKGQTLLLAGWPAVLERVPEAQLVLVGEGPDQEALEAQRVPGVRLAGHSTDVAEWLAAADVVCVPSRREGMSLAMLEAMARGRSVVTTDVPGAHEALRDGGGIVVPSTDPPALAAALAERLLDPTLTAAEGRAARQNVAHAHDLRRSTAAIAGLYGDVLAGRG